MSDQSMPDPVEIGSTSTLLALSTLSVLAVSVYLREMKDAEGTQVLLENISSLLKRAVVQAPQESFTSRQVQQEVSFLRISLYMTMLRCINGLSTGLLILLLTASSYSTVNPDWGNKLMYALMFYFVSYLARKGHENNILPLSDRVVSGTLLVLKLLLLSRTLQMRNMGTIYGLYSTRFFVRMSIGIVELKHKNTLIFSIIACSITAYKVLQCPDIAGGDMIAAMFGELVNVLATWVFFYLVEKLVIDRIEAVVEAREASFEKLASSRMLTAFCDAEALLSNDLIIIQPAKKLSGLLVSNSDLEGKSFRDLLDEADKQRFGSFIAESLASRTSPVNSIQVSLRDSLGLEVQTDIYHVHMVQDGVSSHFLGISCVGERTVENTANPIPTHMDNFLNRQTTSSHSGSSGSSSSAPPEPCSSKDDRTSGSRKLDPHDFPDFHVELTFDPWDMNFPLHECDFLFNLPDDGSPCKAVQALKSWIMPESWKSFQPWVQDAMNDFAASEAMTKELPFTGSLQLKFPALLRSGQMVCAERVVMCLDRGECDDPDDVFPVLKLEGVNLVHRKRKKRTLPKIEEQVLFF